MAISSSPACGVRQMPRERVPAISGKRAGAEQDGAGEPVGVGGGPGEAPGPAEVVGDEMGALDPERVERAAHERRVCRDGLREPACVA